MTVLITLSGVGSSAGPTFNLYASPDGITFTTIIEDVNKTVLEAGYTATVPDGTTDIKVTSVGACTNSYVATIGIIPTTTTTTTTVISYTIGQAALGGIIAYILQPGDPDYVEGEQNGIVVTTTDVSTSALWGCEPTEILGADGTALGTGKQNTMSIIAGCPTAGIAARLCGNLIEGGYSDWFLPSKDELNKVWLNRVAIGGLSISEYWTSSEYSNFQAWFQSFASGGTMNFASKSNLFRVRAVRTF